MEGGDHQVARLRGGGCPAHQRAAAQIQHPGEVEIAFSRRHGRDVADPPHVRRRHVELTVEHVGGDLLVAGTTGTCPAPAAARSLRLKMAQAHQPPTMVATQQWAVAGQGRP